MSKISISQAWSYTTSFFAGQAANHAIILVGIGIFVPLVLQFVVGGGTLMADPMSFAMSGNFAAMGALMALVGLLNYVLQTGSYFASWRIGLTGGAEPLGSALIYGVIAALPTLLLGFVAVLVLGLLAFLIFGSAFAPLMMGAQPSEGAVASTGILLLLLIPFFLLFLLWLGVRFSCTGPVMADRRTFNILTGLGESWRITSASQWKILGYFLLISLALLILFMILGMIVGVSMFASGGTPSSASMIGMIVGAVLLGIPAAYLQVGVPAGIYRALGGMHQADVFA